MVLSLVQLNEGFSGGEKITDFQMAMLEPKLAILDRNRFWFGY